MLINALSASCILAGAAGDGCNPLPFAQQDKDGSQAGDVGLDSDKLWASNGATGRAEQTTSCLGPRKFICIYQVCNQTQYLKLKASRHAWVGVCIGNRKCVR